MLVADWLELVLCGPLVGLQLVSASELGSLGLDNVKVKQMIYIAVLCNS